MDTEQWLWALLMLVLQGGPGGGHDTCSQCHCSLGSSNDDQRAIFNVRSQCSAGSIQWGSAYGAIRLELYPRVGGHYRICFVVDSRNTVTQVSQESPPIRRRKQRLGVEDLRLSAMTRLVSTSGKSREVCVVATSPQPVLLFVEVERTNRFTGIPTVTLQYDVDTVHDSVLSNPMEECRPCTQEELLDAYCTSDFVVVGSMHRVEASENSDHTLIDVAVAQLIHQNTPVFRRRRRDDRFLLGTILAPSKCGIRVDKGDFLFTGRMRLGKAKLRCAPFFKDWLRISAMAECVYN